MSYISQLGISPEDGHVIAMLAAGTLGLCVGSFLSVVAYRLPLILYAQWQGQPPPFSLAGPSSHCPHCTHVLSTWENVPILSYCFVLRGRCKHCDAPISFTYPLVEMATATLSVLTVWHLGCTFQSLWALPFLWALIALTMIDAKEQLLPDIITLPLLWLGLILNVWGIYVDSAQSVLGAALGYLSFWSIFWLFKFSTGKDGMGYGDFKLMAALGGWLGLASVPWMIFLAAILSSVYGIVKLLMKKSQLGSAMPFGPFIAVAGWFTLMFRNFLPI